MAPFDPLYKILDRRSYLGGYRVASAQVTSTLLTFLLLPGRMTSMTSESEVTKRMFSGLRSVCDNLLACKTVPHTHTHTHRHDHYAILRRSIHPVTAVTPELSLGPFCVTRSNPTFQLTDPTRPNPIQLTI